MVQNFEVGSVTQTSIGTESTFGTKASSLTTVPFVSNTLDTTKTEITEPDIRGDRQEVFSRHGNTSVSGNLNVGLRQKNYEALLQSVMLNTFNTDGSAITSSTSISANSTNNSFDSSTVDFTTKNFVVGQYVKTSGFTNSENNGVFRIQSISSSSLTVEEKLKDESSGASVSITPLKFLDVGTTQQSVTLQKFFQRTSLYQVFTGVVVNDLSINVPQDGSITADFGLTGLSEDFGDSTVAASTSPSDPVQRDPFVHIEGSILEGGEEKAIITTASLNVSNNQDPAFVIGKTFAQDINYGLAQFTGSFDAFLLDDSLKNKFLNETETSLRLKFSDTENNFVIIDLPRVKPNSASMPINDPGRIVQSVEFRALKDTSIDTSARISTSS